MPVVSRRGVDLHYVPHGEGPPVFFHTGGGGDGSMWRTAGYVDLLPGFRHIMFDHRGHGASGKPASLEEHELTEYVEDVRAVLDAERAAPTIFVGYSGGGHVGCALAAWHPELVSALVVIGGVAHPDDDPSEGRQTARDVGRSGLAAAIEAMAREEARRPPEWFIENLTSTETEMFALQLEAWASAPNQASFFAQIRCPTLIVCGEPENADGSAELAEAAMTSCEVAVIPDCGHLQAFWDSEVTGAAIARFLAPPRPELTNVID